MEWFISFFGVLILVFLAVIGVIMLLSKVLNFDLEDDSGINMPVMRPLVIPTKNQRTALHKVIVFVTLVRRWKVAENWVYQLDADTTIIIPKAFEFDGASIPRIFWALLSPIGLLLIPGLIHDYGYKYDQLWKLNKDGSIVEYNKGAGKEYWDKIFKDVGDDVNGVQFVNAIAKFALWVGGECTWKDYRKQNQIPIKPTL